MAVTQNLYTGNGSTVLYSFTFPYLETTDIKVSVNGTNTTAYTLANATTIQFNTAPVNGAAIRIYRQTDDAALPATFYSGSAIRANDLNENFTQNLYVTQESTNNAATANTTANTALTNSNTAISTANSAVSTANTASSNASAAVSTANTASSNASAAVSTANTASSNATTAVNTANAATATANSASSTAATALSTANAATSTANAASTAATNAVNTANAASSAASSAVSTANTASTNASNAVTTANTASTNATTAVNTANTAVTTANAAAAAVANAVLYTTVANVAAIPGSPANNTAIEVTNSTGIESFTPLSGLPVGFVGSSGLSVRIIYQTVGSTWTWIQYFPNDPESRYLKLSGGTLTGQFRADDSTSVASPVIAFDGDTNTGIAHTGADELALVTGGTARLTIDPSGNVAVTGGLTKGGNNVVTTGDTGSVTSTMIANDTIVNADISTTAAIAGTKISPDFGSQNVTTTGTSTAASFIPSSSTAPTNGLYLPSANSVAISTGGSGRLFVDASGNVGAGTSSPASRLHVDDGFITTGRYGNLGALILRRAGGTAAAPTQITSAASIAGVYARGLNELGAYNNVSSVGFGSDGAVTSTSSPGYFVVETTPSSSTSPQERLRITSDGKVGVGTSSPGSILHCNSATAVDTYIRSSNSAATSGFDVGVSSGGIAYVFNRNNTDLRFGTNGAERVTVTAGGNVGIGGTAPGAKLDVAGFTRIGNYTGEFQGLSIQNNNDSGASNTVSFVDAINNLGTIDSNLFFGHQTDGASYIALGTTPAGSRSSDRRLERVRITGSGNVGIGTASPSEILQVAGAGRYTGSAVSLDVNGAFIDYSSNIARIAGCNSAGGVIAFYTNPNAAFNTERARIDSSGRLLVGTSSASAVTDGNVTAQFEIEGTTSSTAALSIIRNSNDGNSAGLIIAKTRGTTAGSNTSVTNGDTIGDIRFEAADGTQKRVAANIYAQVDGTPGTNDMPGRLVFSTTADGASSPTERMRIDNTGSIRTFGATNAEALAVSTATVASTSVPLIIGRHTASSTGGGTNAFIVWSGGNVVNTNNSYGAISDAKLKENIVDATSQWSDIKALQVRKYNFKEGQTHTQIGLIAQEVELVSPGLVSESPDRDAEGNDLGTVTKSVNYSVLYMKAVKALQEAMERIETLEAKVAALESA